MPLPSRMNPLARESSVFTLTVKPGILGDSLTYGFVVSGKAGGVSYHVDWGDETSEDGTSGNVELTHTYSSAGTYEIKIKGDVGGISHSGNIYPKLVYDCNGNWAALGNPTTFNYGFSGCSNAVFRFNSLPEGLVHADSMFYNCSLADFTFTELPPNLTTVTYMFYRCSSATLPLTSLPSGLTNGTSMFYGCSNALLPLTSLPSGLTVGASMFAGCSNATLPLTSLPSGLTNGTSMFFGCSNALLPLTSLPSGLTNGITMFADCINAEMALTALPSAMTACSGMFGCTSASEIKLDLDTVAANAPAGGWPDVVSIANMFTNCPEVTGSQSAFLAEFPNVTDTANAFTGTNTTP